MPRPAATEASSSEIASSATRGSSASSARVTASNRATGCSFGHHDDRQLGVKGYDVQPLALDRQPYKTHLRATLMQHRGLLGVGHTEQLEPGRGAPLGPNPRPLAHSDTGYVGDGEGLASHVSPSV